jgi:acyl carrier protein
MDELRGAPERPSLSRLRFMVTIGEILKQSYVQEWFELYPGVKMMNAYGPTEASDSITHFIMDQPPNLASIPVGRPVQNLKIYVLDKLGRLCPIGVRGEICVAGVGVGRGYLFDEQRTAAVFEQDLFETAASGETLRRYHTGDYGCYAPDGNLLFFGRKDFQVKIRGHRIELGDVEAAIAGLDGINNAAVVDRENASGGKYLCAYVSQSEDANWSAISLRNAMKQKLPEHMLPDAWVILPELPVTPNGKVNRKALPEPAGESRALPLYEPPATSREKAVAAIWEEVLGRQVGIDDNFFEIGGHSLRAVQIVSRIRRNLGIDVTLQQLFRLPTVRALTADLSNSSAYKTSWITALPDEEWYAVSHAQKRIWLACRGAESSIAYNMAGAFRLEGPLNVAALVDSLKALVERHESLRTIFALVHGELKQKIREANGFEVALIEAPPVLDDFIAREAELPFDLASGALFRATVARLAEDNNILLLTMHHLVSDAWSVRILIKELRSLYDAFNSGKAFPLEPLPIQGRDHAAWHNRLLESEEMQAHREYWQGRLSGDLPRLELPVDYPRTAALGSNGGRVASSVDENVARALAALAQRRSTSLFGAVLASIAVLLYRYTGQQDLVVGLQSTGRDRQELEDQVGAYLNTVVLRALLEPGLSLGETVSSVGAVLLEALDHSAYPFDLLLEDLRPRTPAQRSPIFDVQIDYVPDLDSASAVDSGNSVGAGLGLAITDLSQDTARTKYDLSFLIIETSQRLEIVTVYNAGLFRRETIERMHKRLAVIQKAFLENEAMTISDIELSGEAQPANPRVRVGLRLGKNKQESAAGELVG